MKSSILCALAATLCAAPAIAQTENTSPAREQNVDLNLQLKKVLQNFALELITLDPANNNFSFTDTAPYEFVGGRAGFFGADEWAIEHTIVFSNTEMSVTDVKVVKTTRDIVTAQVSYSIILKNAVGVKDEIRQQWEKPRHENLLLVKINTNPNGFGPAGGRREEWKIVPPEVAPKPLPTTWQTPPLDNFWANIAYHLSQKKPFQPSGTLAQRSLQNLKMLGMGTSQLTQDFDESYAFAPRYMIHALTPYTQSSTVFQIPDTNEIYAFNANLSGLKTEKVKMPAQTVLFYEGQNEKPTFRYDGKAAICFADGHVALVTPEQAQKLIWKP